MVFPIKWAKILLTRRCYIAPAFFSPKAIAINTKVSNEKYFRDVIFMHLDLIVTAESVHEAQHLVSNGGVNQKYQSVVGKNSP